MSHKRRPVRNPFAPKTYTLVDEMMASPTQPLPEAYRLHQVGLMRSGFEAMVSSPNPSNIDWRLVSDAVNLMETFCTQGPWLDMDGELSDIPDTHGLMPDAVAAMAMAGKRKLTRGALRLDGEGILAIRTMLDSYADLLLVLPHRTVVRCHRMTERRMLKIYHGLKSAHDVEVVSL